MPRAAEPQGSGSRPVTWAPAEMWLIHASDVSYSEVSTTCPVPVSARCLSALRIPITLHIPVPISTTEVPTRMGGRPGSPVTLMSPPQACIRGS